MAFTPERVPLIDADAAVDALRPQCRGAFFAHFPFSHFALDCVLLSSAFLLDVLTTTFSVAYSAIYEFINKLNNTSTTITSQFHTLYKFV